MLRIAFHFCAPWFLRSRTYTGAISTSIGSACSEVNLVECYALARQVSVPADP
jgi:hypothetical protein